MNPEQFQEEKLLIELPGKHISQVKFNSEPYIVKRFFQHDNFSVYQTLRESHHRNICKIFSVKQDEAFFTVREQYLGEHTLADEIPISDRNFFFEVAFQLCDAVAFLHKHRIVHRDLKPENIYLFQGRVVLNDFDISKPILNQQNRNKDTQAFGSVGYASPEQYGFSRSDERSDIYSLGVVFNELLCGELLSERLASGLLRPLIMKCTELNREDRFQSIAEVKMELIRLQRMRSKYALPGFRTHNIKHMVIAIPAYLLLALVIPSFQTAGGTTFYDHFKSKLMGAVILLLPIAVFTNYLNIQVLTPRPLRRYKVIGPLFMCIVLLFSTLIACSLAFGIIDNLLAAYQ